MTTVRGTLMSGIMDSTKGGPRGSRLFMELRTVVRAQLSSRLYLQALEQMLLRAIDVSFRRKRDSHDDTPSNYIRSNMYPGNHSRNNIFDESKKPVISSFPCVQHHRGMV
jgi:hypothetical protein